MRNEVFNLISDFLNNVACDQLAYDLLTVFLIWVV